jgi:hypothetical protein
MGAAVILARDGTRSNLVHVWRARGKRQALYVRAALDWLAFHRVPRGMTTWW